MKSKKEIEKRLKSAQQREARIWKKFWKVGDGTKEDEQLRYKLNQIDGQIKTLKWILK